MTPAARHAPQNARSVWSIPLQSILPNPRQPRRTFDEAALGALAASIRQLGLLQPVAVRAVDASRYELIAGERRLRACALLGMTHIDALVLPATALGSALLALVENLQREDLHYLEEAQGYADVLREEGMTQERLARQIGKSQSAVANKLRLLRLEAPVCQALRAYDLGERHARALLRLPLASLRLEAVQRMGEQRLTARQAEALVLSLLSALQQDGVRRAGYCRSCATTASTSTPFATWCARCAKRGSTPRKPSASSPTVWKSSCACPAFRKKRPLRRRRRLRVPEGPRLSAVRRGAPVLPVAHTGYRSSASCTGLPPSRGVPV